MVERWANHHTERSNLEFLHDRLEHEQAHWAKIIAEKKEHDAIGPEYDLAWTCNLACGDELRCVRAEVDRLKHSTDEIEYYEQTAKVLFQYYDLLQHQEASTPAPRVSRLRKKNPPLMPTRSILDAFAQTSTSNITTTDAKQSPPSPPPLIDKMSLVDSYMSVVDPNHVRPMNLETVDLCHQCKSPLMCLAQDGIILCTECGAQELLLVEQNRPIMRQSSKEASHFSYKRINHFNEWVSQAQGKESTEISEEIFQRIINELKKEKIYDPKTITYSKMREILKRLKINKYYEHSVYIISKLNGNPTPHFPPELEEKLRNMFKEIQGPFLRHCPKERKNFLSYSYVLYKMLELLEKDEYLPFFPLLKSREKLHMQDEIWKCICEDRNWEFIKSI
jgi:uncharacterized Zn finger protein (UPF0148 family)